MSNIKKLEILFILPLIFCSSAFAENFTNTVNTQQQIGQQRKIQDPNILAEEY